MSTYRKTQQVIPSKFDRSLAIEIRKADLRPTLKFNKKKLLEKPFSERMFPWYHSQTNFSELINKELTSSKEEELLTKSDPES